MEPPGAISTSARLQEEEEEEEDDEAQIRNRGLDRTPAHNGYLERFYHTLTEQLLQIHSYASSIALTKPSKKPKTAATIIAPPAPPQLFLSQGP
jgi:hypothetical protein